MVDFIGLTKKIAERSMSTSPKAKNYKLSGNDLKLLVQTPEFVPDL